ncbi:hypothetical protein N431DRAFT_527158 [Stipitochalara longipes BDJ]|nr:hypothetical protein N431DRAFT_527158 [Stipitochalara longipes BDJ]
MLNLYALTLLVGAVGISASPAIAARGCNADNCLRAIEAAAFVTRQGTIDCSSYFRTTVTPATVTVTNTASHTTSTATSLTNTAVLTSTQTKVVTLTTPVTTTSIETDFTTYTVTVEPVTVVTFDKRQLTVVPSSIPAYASACSGSVRYSSACSCVGVTKSTVTAVAPSTTITVTQSFTTTSTYQTTTSTITIVTDLTTTTAVVTDTLDLRSQPPRSPPSYQAAPPPASKSKPNPATTLAGGLDGASTFFIDSGTGALYTDGYYAVTETGNSFSPFLLVQPSKQTPAVSEVSCAIGVGNTFSCAGTEGQMTFQTCYSLGDGYGSDTVLGLGVETGCIPLTLQAICPGTTVITSTAP